MAAVVTTQPVTVTTTPLVMVETPARKREIAGGALIGACVAGPIGLVVRSPKIDLKNQKHKNVFIFPKNIFLIQGWNRHWRLAEEACWYPGSNCGAKTLHAGARPTCACCYWCCCCLNQLTSNEAIYQLAEF